jgi:putative drug exporter of the RND superfamily
MKPRCPVLGWNLSAAEPAVAGRQLRGAGSRVAERPRLVPDLGGVPATGAITFWVPLMGFAFLYWLSMDYEVFILARMREEYDRTGSTRTAIVEGLGRTGRLVTSAALILFLAFVSLATAPDTDIKILATGLGAGILLDATVVRCLLVPATVSLFGRWNWWLPNWAARLLRIPPTAPATSIPELAPVAAG